MSNVKRVDDVLKLVPTTNAAPADGDLWRDIADGSVKIHQGGSTVALGAGGGGGESWTRVTLASDQNVTQAGGLTQITGLNFTFPERGVYDVRMFLRMVNPGASTWITDVYMVVNSDDYEQIKWTGKYIEGGYDPNNDVANSYGGGSGYFNPSTTPQIANGLQVAPNGGEYNNYVDLIANVFGATNLDVRLFVQLTGVGAQADFKAGSYIEYIKRD